jgi:hypothetical protein
VYIYTLTAAPFNLQVGSSVFATVKAGNVLGDSVSSEFGNGATLYLLTAAPTSLTNVNSDRTSITVSWLTPATDGGQPLLDYTVYFKIVGNPSYSVLIDGLTANIYQATIAKNGLVLSK